MSVFDDFCSADCAILGFDAETAFKNGIKEAFSSAARLKELKEKPFLTAKEVEILYGYSCETLKAWRKSGEGPHFHQKGGKNGPVRYTHASVAEYATSKDV